MDNLSERITFVEIMERIARMRRFLREEQQAEVDHGKEVVGLFLQVLGAITANLDPIARRLSLSQPLSTYERIAATRKLSRTFWALYDLHYELRFVRGHWVQPETYDFIENVLAFVPSARRPRLVSVVLSNTYTFEEYDLPAYLGAILRPPLNVPSENPTVLLPKTDRDNPLNWAVLVHECGHVDKKAIVDLLAKLGLDPSSDNEQTRRHCSWAEEFFCDLFAARLLGPAYLASFSAYILLMASLEGGGRLSNTHPPDIVRINVIRRLLERKELCVKLQGWEPYGDLANYFYAAVEDRLELERHHIRARVPTDNGTGELNITEFVDTIWGYVDSSLSFQKELVAQDFLRTRAYCSKMTRGMLISSYVDVRRTESARKSLESSPQTRPSDTVFREARGAVQESRALPWEIINAGWLHKVETTYPEAFTLFFNGVGTLGDKIDTFDNRLSSSDKLLLKSIETSEVHRFFGRKGA